MLTILVLNFISGIIAGFVVEGIYRSLMSRKAVMPKFINIQMYGFALAFLKLLRFQNLSLVPTLVFIFIFPTLVEFATGYLYLKIKGKYLWDYKEERYNFMNLICLRFSIYWFLACVFYYYAILPLSILSLIG